MKAAHTPRLSWLAAAALAVALVACPNQQTPPDTTPDPVSFAPVTGAELNAITESNPVTISGINTAVTVSVSGGEYRIGSAGSYTSAPGTINAGDTLQLRTTAAATSNTAKEVQVTVGISTFRFDVTTKIIPGDISFATRIDQPWGTAIESNTVTLSGISAGTAISVSGAGGSYKINAGAYTTAAGTVNSGDTVTVKGNTASADLTDTVVTLTVGAQVRSFTIRTGKRIPDAFNPALSNQTNAVPGSSVTQSFTVSGITIPTPITVAGGTFTVNGAARTSPSTLNNNDVVIVSATAPNAADGSSSAPVSVTIGRDALNPSGGLAGSFTVSTVDWNPAISFTDQTGVTPNLSAGERYWTGTTLCNNPPTNCPGLSGDPRYQQPPLPNAATLTESNTVTIGAGSISADTPVSILGGEYSKNGAAYTAVAGTVSPGDTLRVRLSAVFPGASNKATLTFGTAISGATSTFGKDFNVTTSNPLTTNVWTANAATAPITIPTGGTASSTITVPTTSAKITKVRVLVTLGGNSVQRSAYVIKLVPPAGTGVSALALMDFVNSKPKSGTPNTPSYLSTGVNPLDPRNVDATGTFPAFPASTTVSVPLQSGTVSQRPWPWNFVDMGFFDGGWGGGVDTIFDSSKFGTDGSQGMGSLGNNDWRTGVGMDTYLDGGMNRNDVYRRCGTDFYLYSRGQFFSGAYPGPPSATPTASLLPSYQLSAMPPANVDTFNTSLNRELPRNIKALPEFDAGVKIDPYTGISDNRVKLDGEYTDGQCKRKDGDTFYPPVAPDPRVGDLTSLNTKNPSGVWTLQVQQAGFEPSATPVTITAFKLIFDFN